MDLRPQWLPALGAFVSAARHQNFARAADELHLTAAAVSHHVRRLEAQLGVVLFQRVARGVKLTPEGRRLADAATAAFADLEAALRPLRRRMPSQRLRLSVLPSICSAWLAPRLVRFAALHPDIRITVDSDRNQVRFDEAGPELGLRYGPGTWPGLSAHYLMDDALFAAAAPTLPGVAGLREPAGIAQLPLIGDLTPQGWPDWFRAAGVTRPRLGEMHSFSDTTDALEAAASGLGAVLARQRLCGDWIASGRLVRLPGPMIPARYAYYLVHPSDRTPAPPAQAFIAWAQREAGATPAAIE